VYPPTICIVPGLVYPERDRKDTRERWRTVFVSSRIVFVHVGIWRLFRSLVITKALGGSDVVEIKKKIWRRGVEAGLPTLAAVNTQLRTKMVNLHTQLD